MYVARRTKVRAHLPLCSYRVESFLLSRMFFFRIKTNVMGGEIDRR